MRRESACAAFGCRLAPIPARSRLLNHSPHTTRIELWFFAIRIDIAVRQQRQTELHRILLGSVRKFIDKTLYGESIERIGDGAPPSSWHTRRCRSVLQLDIGNSVGHIDRTLDLLPF